MDQFDTKPMGWKNYHWDIIAWSQIRTFEFTFNREDIIEQKKAGILLKNMYNYNHPSSHNLDSVLGLGASVLEGVDTTLNRVEEDIARLEVGVDGPGAEELDNTVLDIILRVAIEEADLLKSTSGRVAGNGRDIDDAETGAVVSLVGETVDNLDEC